MISLEDKKIKQLENRLGVFVKDGFGKATQATLNMTVANAAKSARRTVNEEFVIKGAKTQNPAVRGVQFEQTKSLNPRNQIAKVGHTAAFWPKQEFGGVIVAKGREGVPLPTGAAANQKGVARRTKQVQKRNRLSSIKLDRDLVRAKTRAQRNKILIAEARKPGARKEVFLDLGRKQGIFRVTRRDITMLYDMTNRTYRLTPRPVIFPAARRQAGFIAENYERAVRFQLRKAGIR